MGLTDRLKEKARQVVGSVSSQDRGRNWPKGPSPDGLQPMLWDHEVGYDRVTPVKMPDGKEGVVICCRRGVYALAGVDRNATLDRESWRLVSGGRSWDLFTGQGEGAPNATTYAARSAVAVTWIGGPHAPISVVGQIAVNLNPLVVTLPAGVYPPNTLAWRELQAGSGAEADAYANFEVDYLGVLWSTGQVYDSTWRRRRRYKVDMQSPTLLEGWRRGLLGIRPGGMRLLVVPPHMGYGEEDIEETVPSGDTLVFVIQRAEQG